MSEVLKKLEQRIGAKRQEMLDYYRGLIDRDSPVANHARAVADGRIQQILQIQMWINEIRATGEREANPPQQG